MSYERKRQQTTPLSLTPVTPLSFRGLPPLRGVTPNDNTATTTAVNKSFSRETLLSSERLRDIADLEILDALELNARLHPDDRIPDPDICWALGVTGGQVTAMREQWEAGDA